MYREKVGDRYKLKNKTGIVPSVRVGRTPRFDADFDLNFGCDPPSKMKGHGVHLNIGGYSVKLQLGDLPYEEIASFFTGETAPKGVTLEDIQKRFTDAKRKIEGATKALAQHPAGATFLAVAKKRTGLLSKGAPLGETLENTMAFHDENLARLGDIMASIQAGRNALTSTPPDKRGPLVSELSRAQNALLGLRQRMLAAGVPNLATEVRGTLSFPFVGDPNHQKQFQFGKSDYAKSFLAPFADRKSHALAFNDRGEFLEEVRGGTDPFSRGLDPSADILRLRKRLDLAVDAPVPKTDLFAPLARMKSLDLQNLGRGDRSLVLEPAKISDRLLIPALNPKAFSKLDVSPLANSGVQTLLSIEDVEELKRHAGTLAEATSEMASAVSQMTMLNHDAILENAGKGTVTDRTIGGAPPSKLFNGCFSIGIPISHLVEHGAHAIPKMMRAIGPALSHLGRAAIGTPMTGAGNTFLRSAGDEFKHLFKAFSKNFTPTEHEVFAGLYHVYDTKSFGLDLSNSSKVPEDWSAVFDRIDKGESCKEP